METKNVGKSRENHQPKGSGPRHDTVGPADAKEGSETCRAWAAALEQAGCLFFVPEIADYELRREFLRQGNAGAVSRLDRFNGVVTGHYLPLTTPAVRLAAVLWAQVRNQGKMTAPPEALDADALIAAQARLLTPASYGLSGVVVATVNVGHLSALTDAVLWSDIRA